MDYKEVLKNIIKDKDIIDYWLELFPEEERFNESRYYRDFLSFFEDCIDSDLDPNSLETKRLKDFLINLIEIKGEDKFFNFKNSVYTCYLKVPILKKLAKEGYFNFDIVSKITLFFESLTSRIVMDILNKNQKLHTKELEAIKEKEVHIIEIWEKVLMVSIVGSLDYSRVLNIMDKVLNELVIREVEKVIIDISDLHDVNLEVFEHLIKLIKAIKFMGVSVYLVGVSPYIARNLVELNVSFESIKIFSTAKKAMESIIGS